MWTYFLAAFLGILCGFISTHSFLTGTWYNLILWILVGLALGWFVERERVSIAGIIFGIVLTISFLLFAFGGGVEKLPSYLALTALLSLVGAAMGFAVTFTGNLLHTYVRYR